jgi:uncharacterized protein (TIGR02466 family)
MSSQQQKNDLQPYLIPLSSVGVGIYKVPEDILLEFDAISQSLLKNKSLCKKRDISYRLAGQIRRGQQLNILPDLSAKARRYIEFTSLGYATKSAVDLKGMKKYKLKECWLVQQLSGDYNPPHLHAGQISGVFYLKVPKQIIANFSSHERGSDRKDGFIQFILGSVLPQGPWVNQSQFVKPEVGKLCLFPSWLMHAVAPFNGQGDRISISFNLD